MDDVSDEDGIVGGCADDEPSSQEAAAAAPGEPGQAPAGGGQGGKRGAGRAQPGGNPTGSHARSRGGHNRGGRPSSVKAGMKECSDCKLWKPLVDFKPGSAICSSPCFRVKDNVWKACKAEGCLEWYDEQRKDPAKWKKLCRWYTIQCPGDVKRSSKMKTFPVLQYQVTVTAEHEQIRDGVMEMMHEAAYVHWASKPKNKPPKGMTQEEARQEFRRLLAQEDSIVDFEGPNEEFRQRIGVRVNTRLIDRNKIKKSQGYTFLERPNKKPVQADVDKAFQRLHTNMEEATMLSNPTSPHENFKLMTKSMSAQSSGSGSAFDGQLARLGGISSLAVAAQQELPPDKAEEASAEEGEEEDNGDEADEVGSKRKAKAKPKATKKPKIWFDRDLKVAEAVRQQEAWRSELRRTLEALHKSLLESCGEASIPAIKPRLGAEVKVAQVRANALGLVLGLKDWKCTSTNQPASPTQPPRLTEASLAQSASAASPADASKQEKAEEKKDALAPAAVKEDKEEKGAEEEKDAPAPALAEEKKADKGGPPAAQPATQPAAQPVQDGDVESQADSSMALSPDERNKRRGRRAMTVFIASFRASTEAIPPCRSYRSLLPLLEFDDFFARMKAAEADFDLKAVREEMKIFKAALNDLISMSRTAHNALTRGIKICKKAAAPDSSVGGQAAAGDKNVGSGRIMCLFERGAEKAVQAAVLDLSKGPVHALAEPKLIVGFAAQLKELKMDDISQEVRRFKAKFESSKLRSTEGRAERVMKGDALAAITSAFTAVVLSSEILPLANMHSDSQPAVFGVARKLETVGTERGRGPSLRFHLEGTRQVVMTRSSSLRDFMSKNSVTNLTPDALQTFFKCMSRDVIDGFTKEHKLYCCTLGPEDALLTPFDFVFAEKAGSEDVLGVRLSFWMKTDLDAMEQTARWLTSVKKQSSWLQSAVEALVDLTAD